MRPPHDSRLLSAAASLALLAVNLGVMRGQDTPAPVGTYGGRSTTATEIEILDASVERPRIVVLDRRTLAVVRQSQLRPPKKAIEPFGFVRGPEGSIHVLADRGLRLVRYASQGSDPAEELLPEVCHGVGGLAGRLVLTPVRSKGGKFLLAEWSAGTLLRFGTLSSRDATSMQRGIISNLLVCGPEGTGEMPCWHAADGTEVFFLRPDGGMRRVRVPTRATPPPEVGARESGDPFDQFVYPVRDVYPVTRTLFWILTNQEGSIVPSRVGAIRSRHAFLIDERGAVIKTLRLPKEGRAILDATDRNVTIFFADRTIGRRSP